MREEARKDKVYFVNIIPLEKGWSCERFLLFIIKKSIRKSAYYHRFNLNNVRSRSLYFQPKNKLLGPAHITVRSFSTSFPEIRSENSGLAIFSDADKDKLDILKFIKGKSGIYMWTNKLNGKNYVGSSLSVDPLPLPGKFCLINGVLIKIKVRPRIT